MFVTFEGGEGAGKSTQIGLLAEDLRRAGHQVLTTREPGGTDYAEAVRALLLNDEGLSATTQIVGFFSARSDHLDRVIRPALAKGAVVLCDRFLDSTRAYQGSAAGGDEALIHALERAVIGRTMPDRTVLLDLDPEIGLARAAGRGEGADGFERSSLAYHEALRARFLAIATAEPDRVRVVDASGSEENVRRAVRDSLPEAFA